MKAEISTARQPTKPKKMLNDLLDLLKVSGVEDCEATLDVLCSYVLGTDYSAARLMRITGSVSFTDSQKTELKKLVERRCGGEPLEYITGERDFYGFDFRCRKKVLIPRSDTEILVDTALEFAKDGDFVLDLCTGTGCVGIALAKMKRVNVILADISEDALECARENISNLCVGDRVCTVRHDVFSDVPDRSFDIVTANPPYITTAEMRSLGRDVLNEPELALWGGDDGLDFYRIISEKYRPFIKDGGYIFFEAGYRQSEEIANILANNGYSDITKRKDYNNIERVVYARNKL